MNPGIGPVEIFLTFSRISLSGFGGTLFWSHYVLVERQHWLTDREFVEAMGLGQILPGANILNLTVMVGYRYGGYGGVAAALTGFMGWPFLIVIAIGWLYQRYSALPLVQHALSGMSAVAAGLLLASAVRMTAALPRHWRPWLFVTLAFAGVGALRWPLLGVLGALAPLAVAAACREGR